MKAVISDNTSPNGNIISIPKNMAEAFQRTNKSEWDMLFFQFRLNLQSRIAGADERQLLKLQGNLEYSMELEKFFKETLVAKLDG